MRIISGSAGGIPLLVPKDVARPSTDRLREALFSILGERVVEARVLDLFAGSGSLGLECLSRGAASALFLEKNRGAGETIRKNADKARLTGHTIRQSDVLPWLRTATGPFDLVFADPPYKKLPGDFDFAAALLASPQLPQLLAPGGLFVLETLAGKADAAPPPPWHLVDTRTYGSSRISFLQPRMMEAAS